MDALAAIAAKPRRVVAGLLSGTSADGIDCAVCSIDAGGPRARVHLETFRSEPFDPALRERIRLAPGGGARAIAELHVELGDAFADALLRTLVLSGIPEESVDLVGSHGQTVFHHDGTGVRATLQLGDGDRIAERTGFPVVSDFRARDVAAGGEGAPLTPYADAVLFAAPSGVRRAVLNLGGIANVTLLPSRAGEEVVAFDTGPANAPLDRLARLATGGALSFDEDGALAAAGRVDAELLARLLAHPYLARKPPKSTGIETFGDAFVKELVATHRGADADLLATATAFVAESAARGVRAAAGGAVDEVVLAGGGARNPTLVAALAARLAPARVRISDDLGVRSDAREAMAFALLANDAVLGLATSLPHVTGARRAVTLGKLSFPPPRAPFRSA
ncbi:MAG TPA: anhydro-N-acetylmuramic acid kinase [Planctomycetota bacterium]|nr:anhydro-N-acetylmuramic acid kinase [Planctomycetota bacterium]